jgi:hypothetical protein
MGQENGRVSLVEWPSSASPATEGQQLGLLNAFFEVLLVFAFYTFKIVVQKIGLLDCIVYTIFSRND